MRWFPDGTLAAGAGRTDIEWVACLVLHLQAPLIAVQEFREGDPKSRSVSDLLRAIERLGGGQWDAAFDGCPGNRQHVGFLFDKQRVTATSFARLDELNPKGGCKGLLRPGFAGYFKFAAGPDLHVISVHFKSGKSDKDLALRKQSWSGLSRAFKTLQAESADTDVVLLGDLNTMGARGFSAAEEVDALDKALSRQQPAFRRLPASVNCTEISGGRGTLLDHVLVTRSTREVPEFSVTQVDGLCRELGCSHIDRELPVMEQVSDHCPLVVELTPQDLD